MEREWTNYVYHVHNDDDGEGNKSQQPKYQIMILYFIRLIIVIFVNPSDENYIF